MKSDSLIGSGKRLAEQGKELQAEANFEKDTVDRSHLGVPYAHTDPLFYENFSFLSPKPYIHTRELFRNNYC